MSVNDACDIITDVANLITGICAVILLVGFLTMFVTGNPLWMIPFSSLILLVMLKVTTRLLVGKTST